MLAVPNIEKSIHWLLRNPSTAIPSFHIDATRALAAQDLEAINYGVFLVSRPQGSGDLAVTIGSAGGIVAQSVSHQGATRQLLVDLTVWERAGVGRSNRADLHRLGELIRVFLVGLTGTAEGMSIGDITVEAEPFQQDEPPNDDSDDWTMSYTTAYLVFACGLHSDHRRATIA